MHLPVDAELPFTSDAYHLWSSGRAPAGLDTGYVHADWRISQMSESPFELLCWDKHDV